MALKYCRFCNAPLGVGESVPSVGDFCNDDHRRQYQEKIQRETIERLRRTEGRAPAAGTSESARSILQPGIPPNLIPAPPLQSVSRPTASNAAVAFAITHEAQPASVVQPGPAVQTTLAELSKVAEPAATPPPASPVQKTDNTALSNILRQAKVRIASDPNAQTTALALRRRPRPAAKPPAKPAAAPPPPASPVIPGEPPVLTVRVVQDPEPITDPVAPAASAPPSAPAVKPQPQATFAPAAPLPSMTPSAITLDVAPSDLAFTPIEQGLLARLPWYAKAAAILAIAGAAGGAYWQIERSSSAARVQAKPTEERIVPLNMASAGWTNTSATGGEAARQGRVLTVYKPSLELSSYRVEFTGEIAHRAMGWVYRMKDPANYYAAKLHLNPVAKVRLNLVRWKVENGVAGEKTWIPIEGPLPSNGRYVVRIDVKDDTFTTRVQGRQVDRFTDSTFAKGGFAYANENTERGKIESTSIGIYGKPAVR